MNHTPIMMRLAGSLVLGVLIAGHAAASEIRLQGTVTCKEAGDVGARPAQAVLVVPQTFVSQARLSNTEGLYRIDLPAAQVLDRSTTLRFRNGEQQIGQQTEAIWESRLRRFNDRYVYFPRTAEVETPCAVAENDPQRMQQQLALFTEQPQQARLLLDGSAAGGGAAVLATAPSFGGAAVGGPALPGGIFSVTALSASDAVAGRLSSVALSAKGATPGFSFAPTRNIADAGFWNSAALALSPRRTASVASDFDEFFRLSVATDLGERYGIGVGVVKLTQEDRRTATLDNGATRTRSFKLREMGVFLSGGMRLNSSADHPLALGVTFKHMSQELELPRLGDQVVNLTPQDPTWAFTREDDSATDLDVSLSYRHNHYINLGVTIMNLGDEPLKDEAGNPRPQRAVGVGASIMLGAIHYGVDVIHRDEEGTDVAVGLNAVPFNHTRVAIGYDSTYSNTGIGFNFYWFSYNYSDNDIFGDTHMAGVDYQF